MQTSGGKAGGRGESPAPAEAAERLGEARGARAATAGSRASGADGPGRASGQTALADRAANPPGKTCGGRATAGGADGRARLHRFAVFTACATLCLIVAGALVTSKDAGLAVPDWPLSYGSLMPPWVGNIRFEHGHRMVATFVGMLTIVLAVWLWKREPRRWVKRLGVAALATVVAQGVLGGITVLFFLPTAISVSHACLAQIFFCLTVTLALVTGERWRQPVPPALDRGAPPLRRLAILTVAAIFLQLAMGAALRHKGFGITPHLVGAGVVTFMVLWTLYRVISQHAGQPAVMRPAGTLAALLVAQLALGAASYYVRWVTRDAPQPLPEMVWVTVAHVATGALTLAASVWLALEAHRYLAPAGSGREKAAIAA